MQNAMRTGASAARRSQAVYSTFRDPAGTLVRRPTEVLRIVSAAGLLQLKPFLVSQTYRSLIAERSLIDCSILSDPEAGDLLRDPELASLYSAWAGQAILHHPKIWFPSFPYEWPPEMLYEAAVLTLRIAKRSLEEGFGLKDATPFNILFDGGRPLFVDLLSFERRDPLDPTWLAYAQFVRTCLLPLAMHKHRLPWTTRQLLSQPEGPEVEEVYASLSFRQRLSKDFLTSSTIPALLTRNKRSAPSIYQKRTARSSDQAQYILRCLLSRLDRALVRVRPNSDRPSRWSNYALTGSYTAKQLAAKRSFVEQALRETAPRRVLDVGCNDGQFSFLAATGGSSVVAIDSDATVVGRLWNRVQQQKVDVLPLVVDVARPTPAAGWNNQEYSSFVERARSNFDAVLMLAVLHHLLVTERIPLGKIVELAAQLTRDALIIEWVDSEDPLFRSLVRGRDQYYPMLRPADFEQACQAHFHTVGTQRLEGSHRTLYLLRKRS
jgi:SAM-dependent methyltransferase